MRWVVKTELYREDGVIIHREERWFEHYNQAKHVLSKSVLIFKIRQRGIVENFEEGVVLIRRDGRIVVILSLQEEG